MFDLIVFLAERLQGIDPSKDQLNNTIRFEFRSTDHFRTQEQGEENDGLVGDFKAKDGKHLIRWVRWLRIYFFRRQRLVAFLQPAQILGVIAVSGVEGDEGVVGEAEDGVELGELVVHQLQLRSCGVRHAGKPSWSSTKS